MFATYTVIATWTTRKHTNRVAHHKEFTNVRKHEVPQLVKYLQNKHGLKCEVDVLKYCGSKCVSCITY